MVNGCLMIPSVQVRHILSCELSLASSKEGINVGLLSESECR